MNDITSPLAILGGTFDPVHYGHLRLADDVRTALALPEVRLVPAGKPPHRVAPQASARDRIAMLELGVREFPGLVVDAREINRGGKSYTVDTLGELRGEMPHTPLALLIGADAFRGLSSWHRWKDLFVLAHLIVVPRPGIATGTDLPDCPGPGVECATHRRPAGLARPSGRLHLSAAGRRAADLVDGDTRGTRARRSRIGRNCRFASGRRFGLY